MRLTDLLQMTNDLSNETSIFLTIQKKTYPLTKLQISSTECLLFAGTNPMTKAKLIHLVKNLHGRNIPVYIVSENTKIPVYGVQIIPEQNSLRLT